MDTKKQLLAIFCDPAIHDDANDKSIDDGLFPLIDAVGWMAVASALIEILQDVSLRSHWHDAMVAFYHSDRFTHELPCEASYLIALLYDCLRIHPSLDREVIGASGVDENRVWSITIHLKGIRYLSEYEPMNDPEVLRHAIQR